MFAIARIRARAEDRGEGGRLSDCEVAGGMALTAAAAAASL